MITRGAKKQNGFTLVEVIVVSVIVAILAAVAIPLYIGYINDSAQNVANNEAANFANAVSSAVNSGFTADPTGWNASMPGPLVLTWAAPPAGWAGGTNPSYKIGNGVTIAITAGNGFQTGGGATITIRGKTATCVW
jgi:type IV pilus assembly protein PilA